MLAQLSDPHIRLGEGEREAAAALVAAVAAVNALDPAPDAVLVSGDLADHGDPREYARVRELLAALARPVHVLAGNHDDVAALEAVFGPAEYAVRVGPLRTIVSAPGGVPVFTCPGSHLQLALDFGPGAELALADEPPGFALHVLLDGALTTHVATI